MTRSDVYVSLPSKICEFRSPRSREPRRNFERKIRIVFARSQNRWKRQPSGRHRQKFREFRRASIRGRQPGRRNEKRSANPAGVPGLSPLSHCQTTQTVRNQEHRCMSFFDGLLDRFHPLLPRRPIPIVLFDPPEIGVPLLPDSLPMARAGTIPAGNYQKCRCFHSGPENLSYGDPPGGRKRIPKTRHLRTTLAEALVGSAVLPASASSRSMFDVNSSFSCRLNSPLAGEANPA